MDRGKTVGCGAFMIAFGIVAGLFAGGGWLFTPIGFVLLVVGFCMTSKPRPASAHRRLPRSLNR